MKPKSTPCLGLIQTAITLLCLFSLAHSAFAQTAGKLLQTLTPKSHHLGDTEVKDWPETTNKPEGLKLELKFEAEANEEQQVLVVKQRHVSAKWQLSVNGKKITDLKRGNQSQTVYYTLPPGALKSGQNTLTVGSATPSDDIAVGPISLHLSGEARPDNLQTVSISVSDKAAGKAIPARITITDKQLKLVKFFTNKNTGDIAMRAGLAYTRGTETSVDLPEGEYLVFATRGVEWGRAEQAISVAKGKPVKVKLAIEREVDTTGFISADTHLHTLTFSGHGDSSVEERMLTLAGEGLEMAVSTDHNHQTDYRPYQEKMKVTDYFTPVVGNEVTTPVAHVNAFPLDPKAEVPYYKYTNWVQTVDGIRAKGAKVVILNHPRWPKPETCPFHIFGLNRFSGDFKGPQTFTFDGMELANSLVPQNDPLLLVKDWFALLNSGLKFTAVGASDTHTVGEPPGMSRAYLPSKTDDPAKIDVDEICSRYKRGEASVSLGIFADVVVDGRFKPGSTNTVRGDTVSVRLRVAAPSWITPRRALLYVNGQVVEEKKIQAGAPKKPTNEFIEFTVKKPAHDSYLACVILGDGASHPSWKTKADFTFAATNPVFLDTDGDGNYSSPRALAAVALKRAGNSKEDQWKAVSAASDVVAVQMLSLMRNACSTEELAALENRVREAGAQRTYLRDYIQDPLPPVKISAGQLR